MTDRTSGGIGIDPDIDSAFVGGNVVDATGSDLAQSLDLEVMNAHRLGIALAAQLAADASMPSILAMCGAPFRSPDYSDWDQLALRRLYHPDMQPVLPCGGALQKAEAMLIEALQDAS